MHMLAHANALVPEGARALVAMQLRFMDWASWKKT